MGILGNIFFDILALAVTLGILVTIHEFGHFWVARRCGVKVERFSIGFGKPLLKWQRGETEYVIAALPLGGYVKMLGEQDGDVPEHERHRAFNTKPLSRKAAIVAAGPIANFLLAIVLYWVMFMSGVSGIAPVVGEVEPGSPADRAGIMAGDEIVAVDGEETRTWQEVLRTMLGRLGESGELSFTLQGEGNSLTREASIPIQQWLNSQGDPDILGELGLSRFQLDIPARIGQVVEGGRAEAAGLRAGDLVSAANGEPVDGWMDWIEVVRAHPEEDMRVTVLRDGAPLDLSMRPALRSEDGETYGFIGAGVQPPEQMPSLPPEMDRQVSYNPIAAMPQAVSETWSNTVFVLESIRKMIVGLISVENISGPITIAQVAGDTASYGLEYFIGFLAILSISLGVLNLLPIPVLDGGHLFYYLIEAIIRRPVPQRVQEMGMQLGLLLIVGLTFLAFYNDVNRLF